jgi:hypothetical protein
VKYLLLIYEDEAIYASQTEADMDAMMSEYFAYTEELQQSGQMLGGDALQPVATATTVRVRDGEVETSDGPFAETREQLGGFYMVEAKNLDEAIQWAAKIPGARTGSIEIRPVMEFDAPPQA